MWALATRLLAMPSSAEDSDSSGMSCSSVSESCLDHGKQERQSEAKMRLRARQQPDVATKQLQPNASLSFRKSLLLIL